MKTLHKLASIVSTAISLSGIAASQTTTLEAQRAVVVKLHTHFSTQKKDETAAGLFVGKDQQYAYFITARHAVADEVGDQEVHAQSAELWFYGSPESLKASVFERTDAILDLGVVYLPITDLPPSLPQIVRKDAAPNVPVFVIGHPAAGDWSTWQGAVLNENAPNDVRCFTTSSNQSLAHGYSGGPVFDSAGNFLGMHVATETSYGLAARETEVVNQLRAWHVPTNNLTDVGPEADLAAIKRVLDGYQDSFNRRDSNALWKLWPSAPQVTKSVIENSFHSASSIRMTLQLGNPELAPDRASATVAGQFSQLYTPRNGNPQPPRTGDIMFLLKKNAGLWNILEIK
jgi:hypothetical protein